MKKNKIVIPFMLAAVVLGGANKAHALSIQSPTAVSADVNTNVRADAKVSTALLARITKGKDRADQEIDRRVTIMTDLEAKINTLSRLSATEKTNLSTSLQSQISLMTNLKTKIAADTDIATLKTDIASITKSYRIFMLVLPQTHVAATADAVDTTSDIMATIGAKFQARITAAQNAGKDTSAWATLLADYTAKSADAKLKANAAVSATATLSPDNGDKTMMQANAQAFATAKADIAAARVDLKAARDDAQKIILGLKASGEMKVQATTTTSVQ